MPNKQPFNRWYWSNKILCKTQQILISAMYIKAKIQRPLAKAKSPKTINFQKKVLVKTDFFTKITSTVHERKH